MLPTTLDMNIYAAATSRPTSASDSNTSAAQSSRSSTPMEIQGDARRGHLSLEWTLGQHSGVGSTFLVHASWLQPHSAIAAGKWTLSSACSVISQNIHDMWSDPACFSSQTCTVASGPCQSIVFDILLLLCSALTCPFVLQC